MTPQKMPIIAPKIEAIMVIQEDRETSRPFVCCKKEGYIVLKATTLRYANTTNATDTAMAPPMKFFPLTSFLLTSPSTMVFSLTAGILIKSTTRMAVTTSITTAAIQIACQEKGTWTPPPRLNSIGAKINETTVPNVIHCDQIPMESGMFFCGKILGIALGPTTAIIP